MIKQKADSCPERVCAFKINNSPDYVKNPIIRNAWREKNCSNECTVDIIVKSQTPHESNSQIVSGSVFLFSFNVTHLKSPPDFYNWASVLSNPVYHTSQRQILLKAGFSSLFHPHLEVWFWNDWTLSGKHHHWHVGTCKAKLVQKSLQTIERLSWASHQPKKPVMER